MGFNNQQYADSDPYTLLVAEGIFHPAMFDHQRVNDVIQLLK